MLRYFVTLKDFVECSALLEVLELIFKRVVKRQAIGFLVVMIGNPFFMSNSGSILSRLLPSDLSAPALKKKKEKRTRFAHEWFDTFPAHLFQKPPSALLRDWCQG